MSLAAQKRASFPEKWFLQLCCSLACRQCEPQAQTRRRGGARHRWHCVIACLIWRSSRVKRSLTWTKRHVPADTGKLATQHEKGLTLVAVALLRLHSGASQARDPQHGIQSWVASPTLPYPPRPSANRSSPEGFCRNMIWARNLEVCYRDGRLLTSGLAEILCGKRGVGGPERTRASSVGMTSGIARLPVAGFFLSIHLSLSPPHVRTERDVSLWGQTVSCAAVQQLEGHWRIVGAALFLEVAKC